MFKKKNQSKRRRERGRETAAMCSSIPTIGQVGHTAGSKRDKQARKRRGETSLEGFWESIDNKVEGGERERERVNE